MAVSGSGTQADPYIVDNWADFQTVNVSGNRSKYVQFKSPHKDYTNNTITLSGDGSYQNPYIVSSYEELLYATGVTATWEVDLIDADTRLYVYAPDENTEIYCRYDSSLSTIDFNDIAPNGFSSNWYLESRNDFNGWTFLNMRLNNNCQIYNENSNSDINNLIMLNFFQTNSSGFYSPFRDCKFINCIFQGEINSTGDVSALWYAANTYSGLVSSSFSLKYKCGSTFGVWNFIYTYQNKPLTFENSLCDIDVEAYSIGQSDYSSNTRCVVLENSLLKGKMKATNQFNVQVIWSATSSIIDLEKESSNAFPTPYGTCVSSVFNSDKLSIAKTGLVGATTAELLSPSALQSKGLPIGVDEDETNQ